MAVGKAGEPAVRDKLSIWFGGIRVAQRGARDPAYNEAEVSAVMKKPEITLKVALEWAKAGTHSDLRPHQGVCGDQRRLSLVTAGDDPHDAPSAPVKVVSRRRLRTPRR